MNAVGLSPSNIYFLYPLQMTGETINFFGNWTVKYIQDEEFAASCRQFINECELKKQSINQEIQQKERSWTNDRRTCYESEVENFGISMQNYMSQERIVSFKSAMMYVYDKDDSGNWFMPRNPKEDFNVANFCRTVYYLYSNKFFNEASFNGKPINIDGIVNIILGKEPTGSYIKDNAQLLQQR